MLSVPTQLNRYVLSILARCNHVNHLKQLQAYLTVLGHAQTQFFAFKLVRFCTLSLSNLSYARCIFDSLPAPNIYLYTAMITAYASQADHQSAFELYGHMVRKRNPPPNQFIFPHVLKCCPEVSMCSGTEVVHAQILKFGFGQYPVVQTGLVDAYSRGSCLGAARQVFDEMRERSIVSWTAMVFGYTRVGDIKNALLLFEEMPDRDVPSWNAVIAGCTQNGSFPEAISLFRRMVIAEKEGQEQKLRPNQVTIVCVLSACGHTGMLQLGKCVHGYVYRNSLYANPFISNALVDMYGKCGSLRQARWVFNMASKRGLTSWNSMINSFALHGQSNEAISVFEELMQCTDVTPDEVTFVGLLNACTHGGLVERGRAYFELMTCYYCIEPQIQHYGCLIDLLGRAGRFEEALKVIAEMKLEPDEVVWGSLLNGCKIHGRADLAEFAVKKLIEIDPKNGSYGIMLANLYGELDRWDEARKLRKMLKDQNAYKIPGCSWIEVDSQVHQFYSVDKSHPRMEEMYNILESLIGFYKFDSAL